MNGKKLGLKAACFLAAAVCLAGCMTHLREAKRHFVKGQEYLRIYRKDDALSEFKRARTDARLQSEKHPTAQSCMIEGLCEINLGLWDAAAASFRQAFFLGFEKGEEWAEWVSLFGLAEVFRESGLTETAAELFEHLCDRSRLREVNVLAAERIVEFRLQGALQQSGKEKDKSLASLLSRLESISERDITCGYFHYLRAQVLAHLSEFRRSYEEAVFAKELGLPRLEIAHDNDLQIVFCYRKLTDLLTAEFRDAFLSGHMQWVRRWGWPGPETPDWRQDSGMR